MFRFVIESTFSGDVHIDTRISKRLKAPKAMVSNITNGTLSARARHRKCIWLIFSTVFKKPLTAHGKPNCPLLSPQRHGCVERNGDRGEIKASLYTGGSIKS